MFKKNCTFATMEEIILILDFGAQYTQIIARKIRELHVFCDVRPYNKIGEISPNVKGIILSGGTFSSSDKQNIVQTFGKIPVLEMCNVSRLEDIKPVLKDFAITTCRCSQNWTPDAFIESNVKMLREQLQNDKVILAISGGVDSSVTAYLLQKAIGNNMTGIFVNHGLLRKNEFETVLVNYKKTGLNVIGVDASALFLQKLKGVNDPEQKRKMIGNTFIEVFDNEAHKIQNVKWLAQGTIYPDVIESVSVDGTVIKSHHNVSGLPDRMKLKIVEPLRLLFKDEVRQIGQALGISSDLLNRHPFPGPGLGIRILGEITEEKVRIIQEVDAIFIDKLRKTGWYEKTWQAAAILLPIKTVGVTDDKRTYENCVALRAITSTDAMTADWVHLPYELLAEISTEIITKTQGVNRVVYDISSKPPATIEWE